MPYVAFQEQWSQKIRYRVQFAGHGAYMFVLRVCLRYSA
jgi:hypothetical protein